MTDAAGGPDSSSDAGAGLFVVGLWAALVAAALAFVALDGPAFPRWDDFAVVPVLIGEHEITPEWLWALHNEHRVPLPMLVLLAALRSSANDFRAGMVVNVALLAVAALAAAVVARRRRGAWRESDAVFALGLLHCGHEANLLWAWQVQFVLSTALAVGLLARIVAAPGWPRRGATVGFAVMLCLLPLCGANGVALVPALAVWLAVAGQAQLRQGPSGRSAGIANLAASAVALGLVLMYFRGYQSPTHHVTRGGLVAALTTSLQFLSMTFGPTSARLWPYSGVATAVLIVATIALLLRTLAVRPDERPRAFGLLAFLGAIGSLGLGLGWGRAGASGLGGFEPRYVTLAAPLGFAVYFAWDLYGAPTALRRLVPLVVFAALLVLLWPNTETGLAQGRELAEQSARFESAIRSGAPLYRVVKAASPLLHPSADVLTEVLPKLHDARLGVFRFLKPNPPFRVVAVPVEPTEVQLARWEDKTAHVTGVDPQLTFTLPQARHVAGIRLRYSHSNPAGTSARFKIAWRRPGQTAYPPAQGSSNWYLPTGRDRETTVWVDDLVHDLRIQPDNQPCEFHLDAIELLIPEK